MQILFSLENMQTMSDRCGVAKLRVNGCVCFSVFQELIFVFEKRD